MMMRFDDDVVIVTGAGRGLGRAFALAFAERGAAVVVNDLGNEMDGNGVSQPVAQQLVDEIIAAGGRAVANTDAVGTRAAADAIVKSAIDAFGKVTVLVNCAGIIRFAPLTEIDEEHWRLTQQIMLEGTFHLCAAAWPHMAAQNYGRIVNITSNSGFAGNETLIPYASAKLGVAALTKCLAQEAVGTGITVNAIAPMAVTRMNIEVFFGGKAPDSDDWQTEIREGRVPMGPPSIIAPTVLWLAHRDTLINGEIYSTSSGKVARVGFVIGEGYFNPDHTPEDLAAHVDQIRTLGNYLDPSCTGDEVGIIPPLFMKG
ncbi:MAG: SDR family NAD(P)-dependent oxidoreductase [Pseudomonadota bacterium]